MITMLIYSPKSDEREFIFKECKRLAALESDERWDFIVAGSEEELLSMSGDINSDGKDFYDIACADICTQAGFETVQKIRSVNPLCHIILISEKEISADNYVKPSVIPAGLMIRPMSASYARSVLSDNISAYIKQFYGFDREYGFVLESREGRRVIPYGVIDYFEAREKKIMLYTCAMEYSFYDTIDNLEKTLPNDFIRCHRSFIVRKDKIVNIMLSKNVIVLTSGEMIPVSRTYKPVIKSTSLF